MIESEKFSALRNIRTIPPPAKPPSPALKPDKSSFKSAQISLRSTYHAELLAP